MDEIQKLIEKIKKDSQDSGKRIAFAQKEIQELVKERKELKAEWEQKDKSLEIEIAALTKEIDGILGRQMLAEELIKTITI